MKFSPIWVVHVMFPPPFPYFSDISVDTRTALVADTLPVDRTEVDGDFIREGGVEKCFIQGGW